MYRENEKGAKCILLCTYPSVLLFAINPKDIAMTTHKAKVIKGALDNYTISVSLYLVLQRTWKIDLYQHFTPI